MEIRLAAGSSFQLWLYVMEEVSCVESTVESVQHQVPGPDAGLYTLLSTCYGIDRTSLSSSIERSRRDWISLLSFSLVSSALSYNTPP